MKHPRPNDRIESFCQWFIIMLVLMWTLGSLIGQPAGGAVKCCTEYKNGKCVRWDVCAK